MRWPFAMRSTVDAMQSSLKFANKTLDQYAKTMHKSNQSAQHWERRCEALYDPERCQPESLAEYVMSLESKQHAAFLIHCAQSVKDWKAPFSMQSFYVADELAAAPVESMEEVGFFVDQLLNDLTYQKLHDRRDRLNKKAADARSAAAAEARATALADEEQIKAYEAESKGGTDEQQTA